MVAPKEAFCHTEANPTDRYGVLVTYPYSGNSKDNEKLANTESESNVQFFWSVYS